MDEVGKSKFEQVNRLRGRLSSLSVGESSLISFVGKPIMDRAFFPGGNGLFLGEDAPRFPVGGTLVLGSNFGAAENYCDPEGRLRRSDETNEPGTWAGLRGRFTSEQLRNAFLTNAWPFLHPSPATEKKRTSNLDRPEKWLEDRALMTSCLAFFRETLDEVRPSLIVALGTGPAAFLGNVWPELIGCWRKSTWKDIDSIPIVEVPTLERRAICVAITHPSMSNAHNRIYLFCSAELEKKFVQDAFRRASALAQSQGEMNIKGETIDG